MNILYVCTISDTINAFLVPHIRMLAEAGHRVDVACHVVRTPAPALQEMGCTLYDIPFARAPLRSANAAAYRALKALVSRSAYDIVHCHTPVASFLTRMACRKLRARGTRVFYTTHGFHFYRGAPPLNWAVYYPLERLAARHTDALIAINAEDLSRAKGFAAGRVAYMPGAGMDIAAFEAPAVPRRIMRERLGLAQEATVVLSVGELNGNKNHQVVLRALGALRGEDVHYVLVGEGPTQPRLRALAAEMGISSRVHLMGYRTDVVDFYHMADIFAFPSRREGLGLSALEAMAAGLPLITTGVHGIADYAIAGQTALLCGADDSEGFARAILSYRDSPGLRDRFIENGRRHIRRYAMDSALASVAEVYGLERA